MRERINGWLIALGLWCLRRAGHAHAASAAALRIARPVAPAQARQLADPDHIGPDRGWRTRLEAPGADVVISEPLPAWAAKNAFYKTPLAPGERLTLHDETGQLRKETRA